MAKKSNAANTISDTGTDIVKRKSSYTKGYRNSPVIGDNGILAEKGEIADTLSKLRVIYNLPRVDTNNVKQIEDRISWYFDYCIDNDLKPLVEGLAVSIGVHRDTLNSWERGERGGDYSDIIKKAKQIIQFLLAQMAVNGKINPVTWIFYGKNYFGMVDKQEYVLTPNNPLGEQQSPSEIAKRLSDGLSE